MIPYNFKGTQTTLVHICCSVDSHHFLTQLQAQYPQKNFCGFFYNPNIHPYEEYLLRYSDVQRSCKLLGVPLIEGKYDLKEWLDGSRGMECEPEKGDRCGYCFDYRLEESAKIAKEIGCYEFTTTLLASPMKAQHELFALGEAMARRYDLEFLPIDVRSKGGTTIQNQLAKEAQLYRQNYCGCLHALKPQRTRSQKIPLELVSSLSLPKQARNLPSQRIQAFQTRESLERAHKPYESIKRKVLKYQLLSGTLSNKQGVIPSFILQYSMLAKPLKAKIEFWHEGIGYASKEGIIFLAFDAFKKRLGCDDFHTLLKQGLAESLQMQIRVGLYGHGLFVSPILIVSEPFDGEFSLAIDYGLQDESLEDFVMFS